MSGARALSNPAQCALSNPAQCAPSNPARRALLLALPALVAACAAPPIARRDGASSARAFSLTQLAQGDIDGVAEIVQTEQLAALERLTRKLYLRNPAHFRRTGQRDADAATAAVFAPVARWQHATDRERAWREPLAAVWQAAFPGDRVAALASGLVAMQLAAYGDRTEFYYWNELDAQKLYNAARNLEAVAWALASKRDAAGTPLLVSNELDPAAPNLSFEREFGKLIALNDALARIVEDKSNRAIRAGVVNLAGFVLLPI